MPVLDHEVHEKTKFKRVPLSPCHSSLPNQLKPGYWVMNLEFDESGIPSHANRFIGNKFDIVCKQPIGTKLPECRGCTKPTRKDSDEI